MEPLCGINNFQSLQGSKISSIDRTCEGVSTACLDWISQQYYFPVEKSGTIWIANIFVNSNSTLDKLKPLPNYLSQRQYQPQHLQCHYYHSALVWTETDAFGTTHLFCGTISQIGVKDDEPRFGLHVSELLLVDYCSLKLATAAISTYRKGYTEMIAVVTTRGVWLVNYNETLGEVHCERLIEARHLLNHTAKDIFSISFSGDAMYFLSHSAPGVHKIELQTKSWNTFTIIERAVKLVDDSDLDAVPDFPRVFYQSINLEQEELTSVDLHEDQLPPPARCLFPTVQHLGLSMIEKSVGQLLISIAWNQDYPCFSISHPMLQLDVRIMSLDKRLEFLYANFSSDPINQSVVHSFDYYCTKEYGCPSEFLFAGFRTVPPSSTSVISNTSSSVLIGEINSGETYLVEVQASPLIFDQKDLDDLYTNVRAHALVKKFTPQYDPPKSDLSFWLKVLLVPTVLIAGLLSMGLALCYRRIWYVYRSLRRLNRNMFTWQDRLGEGHFSEVWKATLRDGKTEIPIAVKQLKLTANEKEKRQFLEEAILISKLVHPNIIRAIGISMESKPILLALEFMDGGSLEHYLHSEAAKRLTPNDLSKIGLWVAYACAYLEKQGYVHRDIAARNCLVLLLHNLKPKTVKLSDFGLAKDVQSEEVYTIPIGHETPLPIAHAAPESFNGSFSSKSDVWAFGVLLWEVFTHAEIPYRSWNVLNQDQREQMITNWVCRDRQNILDMTDPVNHSIPVGLKDLMRLCWAHAPSDRPTFDHPADRQSLVKLLKKLSKQTEEEEVVVEKEAEPNTVSVPEEIAATEDLQSQLVVQSDPYALTCVLEMFHNPYATSLSNGAERPLGSPFKKLKEES